MSLGTIYSYPMNPRVMKAKIAAAYTGETIAEEVVDLMKPREASFLAKFPHGKVPGFAGKDGVNLFESSAIAYYALAKKDSPLLGTNAVEKATVLQWVLFSETEIQTNVSGYIGPLMGYAPYLKPAVDLATERLHRSLATLNKVLESKTYLVGESVTFADIAVVCSLVWPFKTVLDAEARKKIKNLTRYFTTVVGKEHFKAAFGEVELCKEPLKYTPPKKEKKESAKKPEPPKKDKKEKKAAAPADDAEEDAPKPAPKPKSKLDLLPPSPFVLDAWKRMYSNNDSDVANNWFWENFDSEGWSIWRVDYRYNDELTLVFMSNNLIGGFFARLEMARKYAFGSLVVCGENNNNTISGIFVIRGQEVPFEVYDAADYPSYKFEKIEPSQYEARKKEIEDYFAWEVPGFADGKIFK
ncbi:hypothetical protein BC940DRAFT_290469 [Gongronella butleri]|nr:hypothetical protein BC940DRAFT_290469 [Gongronella butleri]